MLVLGYILNTHTHTRRYKKKRQRTYTKLRWNEIYGHSYKTIFGGKSLVCSLHWGIEKEAFTWYPSRLDLRAPAIRFHTHNSRIQEVWLWYSHGCIHSCIPIFIVLEPANINDKILSPYFFSSEEALVSFRFESFSALSPNTFQWVPRVTVAVLVE